MRLFGISVILCVHNGSQRITPTLVALAKQKIPADLPCELLIIDNASTDATREVAWECWVTAGAPYPLNILSEPKAGKANALTTGYNQARYELMLLCDDDNWLQPEYLKTVYELYSAHPEIGLLGGYGRALFDTGTKPQWFNKWENLYVCGRHHQQNGFLKPLDFSIWGAGSIVRKTMWSFLTTNGFTFYNSTHGGKAMTEDSELSMIITLTGQRLYFDDRLWFTHDLRGGRITWENLLAQQALNGKTHAILYIYRLVADHASDIEPQVRWFVIKKILGLCRSVVLSSLKPGNRPRMTFFINILYELATNRNKYEKLAIDAFSWIPKIMNTRPLDNRDSLSIAENGVNVEH